MAKSCQKCGKTVNFGNSVSHSRTATKRLMRPNLQSRNGRLICTQCSRTATNQGMMV